jgi:hypothetical protein
MLVMITAVPYTLTNYITLVIIIEVPLPCTNCTMLVMISVVPCTLVLLHLVLPNDSSEIPKHVGGSNDYDDNNNIKFTTRATLSHPRFMQPEVALSCTQTPAIWPYHVKVAPINSQVLITVRQF